MAIARQADLAPGLYLVATPIGAARDITLRALDVLASADVLVAEDTRTLRHLLDIHGIALGDRPLLAYHDHSPPRVREALLRRIADGASLAYASEAGTPMVADPGFELGRAAAQAGHLVSTAPGPSAVIAALTLSGLPTDRFFFAGFLPSAKAARKTALVEMAAIPGTLVFYESPRRLAATLEHAAATLGETRPAAVCRELTKRFEEVRRGSLAELADIYAESPPKGEIVLLIGAGEGRKSDENAVQAALVQALSTMRVKDAADAVALAHDLPRRDVYQMALKLKERQ